MHKVTALKSHGKRQAINPSMARLLGGAICFFVAYLGSMAAINFDDYPIHRLAVRMGIILGILLGNAFAYWRNRRTA